MSRPKKRQRSSFYQFRKRVPADVLTKARGKAFTFIFSGENEGKDLVIRATVGNEVSFSLRARDPAVAVRLQASALLQFEQHCDTVRNGPKPLTRKQQVALSGVLYRAFAEGLEEDPGDSEIWAQVQAANEAAMAGDHPRRRLLINPPPPEEYRKNTMEKRFGGPRRKWPSDMGIEVGDDLTASADPEDVYRRAKLMRWTTPAPGILGAIG